MTVYSIYRMGTKGTREYIWNPKMLNTSKINAGWVLKEDSPNRWKTKNREKLDTVFEAAKALGFDVFVDESEVSSEKKPKAEKAPKAEKKSKANKKVDEDPYDGEEIPDDPELEMSFFRDGLNKLCIGCQNACKQSVHAQIIRCPQYKKAA